MEKAPAHGGGTRRDGSEEKTAGQAAPREKAPAHGGGTRRDGSEEKTAGQAAPREKAPAHGGGTRRDGSEEKTAGRAAPRLLHTEGGQDGTEEKTPGRAAPRLLRAAPRPAWLVLPHDNIFFKLFAHGSDSKILHKFGSEATWVRDARGGELPAACVRAKKIACAAAGVCCHAG